MEVTALHDSLVSDREIAAAPVRLLQPDWSASRASGGRAELSSALPAACVAALDAFASGREVAPLSVLAAAFAALLQRYGGSRLAALALGSRERSWPVALEFDWSCDFAQAVAAVEAASDDARRQARSFDERLARYAFSDAPQVPDGAWERALAACDLHVEFNRARASMRWHYDAALFERETIARFASHFVRLLEGALAAPATALDSITVLDADERERIVALGIGAAPPYERDATIAARFAAQVARYPSRIAAIASDGALRYDELERDSERVAAALYRRGVRAGARVGVAFERSLRLPAALLGILKLGAAYVPLDPSYPRERLEFILADADVSAIVSDGALPAALAHDPGIRLDVAAALGENGALDYPRPHASGDDLAYVIYTSGSTGRPKGVAVPQRAILRLVAPSDWLSLADDETFLQLAPLAFDASTFEMWAPLLNGARLAIAEPGLLSSAELGATIAHFGVTTIFLTTTLFERLVDEPNARPECLRRMLTGGEIASPDHMARFLVEFPACRLAAVYGPTENTTFSTWFEIPMKGVLGRSVPIGRPIAHSSAYVVDERLELLPLGAVGQLAVGGDGVALGYLNAPERTAERFVPDPFSGRGRLYLTGDLARCRPDGVIEFFGRRDHQVKVRGFRIELGEIEAALQRERAVRD
ncbi:MAG: amino acid adenylation domain-containing protein, partial [Vulcanimicrobiaceae bacterium]